MTATAWAIAGVGAVVVATCIAAAIFPPLARLLDRLRARIFGDDNPVS